MKTFKALIASAFIIYALIQEKVLAAEQIVHIKGKLLCLTPENNNIINNEIKSEKWNSEIAFRGKRHIHYENEKSYEHPDEAPNRAFWPQNNSYGHDYGAHPQQHYDYNGRQDEYYEKSRDADSELYVSQNNYGISNSSSHEKYGKKYEADNYELNLPIAPSQAIWAPVVVPQESINWTASGFQPSNSWAPQQQQNLWESTSTQQQPNWALEQQKPQQQEGNWAPEQSPQPQNNWVQLLQQQPHGNWSNEQSTTNRASQQNLQQQAQASWAAEQPQQISEQQPQTNWAFEQAQQQQQAPINWASQQQQNLWESTSNQQQLNLTLEQQKPQQQADNWVVFPQPQAQQQVNWALDQILEQQPQINWVVEQAQLLNEQKQQLKQQAPISWASQQQLQDIWTAEQPQQVAQQQASGNWVIAAQQQAQQQEDVDNWIIAQAQQQQSPISWPVQQSPQQPQQSRINWIESQQQQQALSSQQQLNQLIAQLAPKTNEETWSPITSNKTTNLIIPAAQPQLDDFSWKAIIPPKNSQPVSQENWLRKRREAIISTETTSFKPEKVVDNKPATIQPNHQTTQEAIQSNQNKKQFNQINQRLNFKNDKEAMKKRLKTKVIVHNFFKEKGKGDEPKITRTFAEALIKKIPIDNERNKRDVEQITTPKPQQKKIITTNVHSPPEFGRKKREAEQQQSTTQQMDSFSKDKPEDGFDKDTYIDENMVKWRRVSDDDKVHPLIEITKFD